MKRRYRLYRRNGTFYLWDNVTGRRESLETKNPGDAQRLLHARNEAQRQPALNLHIAKAYLAGADSGITTRTWEEALRVIIDTKHGPTKERWQRAAQERPLDVIRHKIIVETQANQSIRLSDVDARFLKAVIDHRDQRSSLYAKLAGISGKLAVIVRRRLVADGLLREHQVATLVVLLFLANFRATLITLTAIPLSLVTAVLTLKWFGASINTMTLGGMAIAIGALVDDAVIDVENVFRRLRENHRKPEGQRRPALQVVFEASVEIRSSIVFATLVIALVFTPIFFLAGVEGRLLQPLGVAYLVALLASLLVAVTVTPVLQVFFQ